MSKRKPRKENEANGNETNEKVDKSPFVYQRDKIKKELEIRQNYELTENQKKLIDIILDKKTRVVFVNGGAGTSKTYIAVLAGLMLLNKRGISDIIYVRSIIESASKSLGSLPGELGDKFGPFLRPLEDKLEELLDKSDIDYLKKEGRISGIPVNFLRGASLNAKYIICDEGQNLLRGEMATVLTRLGKYSKLIICADPFQSDVNGKSGFMPLFDLFNDESSREQGIVCFSFTKDDIVRSGILKYILERIENAPKYTL